jgi:hypothetical protein
MIMDGMVLISITAKKNINGTTTPGKQHQEHHSEHSV